MPDTANEIDLIMNLGLSRAQRLGSGHPVFKAQSLRNYMWYVFKGEMYPNIDLNEARNSANIDAQLYRKVTKGFGKLRLLQASELPSLAMLLPVDARRDLAQRQFWYVMDLQLRLHALSDLNDAANGRARAGIQVGPAKPEKIAEAKRVLPIIQNHPDAMNELGRICAVDMFTGGNDRFAPDIDRSGQFSGITANVDNIFFKTNDKLTEGQFCGIDFWDPNSAFKSMFKDVDAQTAAAAADVPPPQWAGKLLGAAFSKVRDNLASGVTGSLNQRLGNNCVLGPKHEKAFRKGLDDAIPLLKKAAKEIKASGIIPPIGLFSRMRKLNW